MKKTILVHTILLNILLFLSVIFVPDKPYILLAAAIVVAGILLLQKKDDWRAFVFGMMFGVALEFLAVRYNAWTYPYPNIWGVPYWILVCWGVVSLTVHRLETYWAHKRA